MKMGTVTGCLSPRRYGLGGSQQFFFISKGVCFETKISHSEIDRYLIENMWQPYVDELCITYKIIKTKN